MDVVPATGDDIKMAADEDEVGVRGMAAVTTRGIIIQLRCFFKLFLMHFSAIQWRSRRQTLALKLSLELGESMKTLSLASQS